MTEHVAEHQSYHLEEKDETKKIQRIRRERDQPSAALYGGTPGQEAEVLDRLLRDGELDGRREPAEEGEDGGLGDVHEGGGLLDRDTVVKSCVVNLRLG